MFCFLFVANFFAINASTKSVFAQSFHDYKTQINSYLDEFYVDIKSSVQNRTAGSEGEKFLANKLATYLQVNGFSKFADLDGYLQEFKIKKGTSNNVLGVIDNQAEKYVIIGAHYDAVYEVGKSYGYSDNMSGVVANLIMAENLKSQNQFNVIVAFWGAEETGCNGSMHFAKNLPNQIRQNVMLYVNYDSIGAGDYLYYYHNDFQTKYGKTLDKFFKGYDIKKYANQLYATNANLGINYTNLGLNSDNSSFLKQAMNSLNFWAGNLDANNGLGFFETKNHDKIMHNTDSKATIDEVFGESFVDNINSVINISMSLLTSSDFNAENFAGGQIKTYLYSDWVLKGFGVCLVGVLFVVYFVFNHFANKKNSGKK